MREVNIKPANLDEKVMASGFRCHGDTSNKPLMYPVCRTVIQVHILEGKLQFVCQEPCISRHIVDLFHNEE